ncbi:MAG: serine hydrolase domain-containing protein [Myxococcaceae bacterium]|nr:serine hydrolase domain-containing protein [Myxococcaceae bacterium]
MTELDALLEEGRQQGVYSHARAVVRLNGQTVFDGGPAPTTARFDLASVTKVMATTALLLRLVRDKAVSLDQPVRRWLPRCAADVSLADLACHRSGLAAWRPFFADVTRTDPGVYELPRRPEPTLRAAIRARVVEQVESEVPERTVGAAAVYSDLGFILLGAVVEQVCGLALDSAFRALVADPLGLDASFRRISTSTIDPSTIDTGGVRPRAPAPGQEGLWTWPAFPSRPGEVDDDNAWVMDGVAGHAGLFGTAPAVAAFGQAVLEGWLLAPERFRLDSATPGSTRTIGFDTPSAEGASCGPRFGRAGPLGAIGHLGFTGTSVWIDFDRQLVVALLTNRVIFGRENLQIRAFRPRFHEAVLDALGL